MRDLLVRRPDVLEVAYVVLVGGLAAWGWFVSGTTLPILAAVALGLPTSVAATVLFYLSYGMVSLVLGGDSDVDRGGSSSAHCSPTGRCVAERSGSIHEFSATMFVADTIGVLLLMAAAAANVVFVRWLIARRRGDA